MDNGKGSR